MSAKDATIELYKKKGISVEQLRLQGYDVADNG